MQNCKNVTPPERLESKKLNAIKDGNGRYLFSRAEVTRKAIEMGIL